MCVSVFFFFFLQKTTVIFAFSVAASEFSPYLEHKILEKADFVES